MIERSFFQIKYEITTDYYNYLVGEKYTPGQSAGRCFYDCSEEIDDEGIEAIITISTIVGLLSANGEELSEGNLDYVKMALKLYEDINVSEYLTDVECEYLEEDMSWLKAYYKKEQNNI